MPTFSIDFMFSPPEKMHIEQDPPISGSFHILTYSRMRCKYICYIRQQKPAQRPAKCSVFHMIQIESTGWSSRTGPAPVKAFHDLAEIIDTEPSQADIRHRSDDIADHVIEEAAAMDAKLQHVPRLRG